MSASASTSSMVIRNRICMLSPLLQRRALTYGALTSLHSSHAPTPIGQHLFALMAIPVQGHR